MFSLQVGNGDTGFLTLNADGQHLPAVIVDAYQDFFLPARLSSRASPSSQSTWEAIISEQIIVTDAAVNPNAAAMSLRDIAP